MAYGDSYLLSENKFGLNLKPKMVYATIDLRTKKFGGEHITRMRWDGYNLNWLMKWMWYFRYRAALLQVQNPKLYVELNTGSYKTQDPVDEKTLRLRKLKKDITTAKRMITKLTNAIAKYQEQENKTLIPDWENPQYLKAVEKLGKYKDKLEKLQNEQDQINQV